jgi:CubicO group peptidase (beta-lactamase class C family)
MKRGFVRVAALLGVVGLSSYVAHLSAASPGEPSVNPPDNTPLREKMDGIFGEYRRTASPSPGCAVAVARAGETLFADGYGFASLEHGIPITPETVFDIGSAAKQFTAASIVLLEQDGKLSLDDSLARFVPELPEWARRTTLRQLLHHTSGIRDYTGLLDLAGARTPDWTTDRDAIEILARQRGLDFPPGSRYSYSNSGYFLLSLVVERASGRSLKDFAEERIFGPLKMTSTRFVHDHRDVVPRRATGYAKRKGDGWGVAGSDWEQNGDGGLQTTVGDLLRWDHNFDEPKVGGRRLVEELVTPGKLSSGEPIDYALALRVDRDNGLARVRHGGSWAGFKAEFLRYPERRVTVVTLCNFREAVPSRLGRAAARAVIPELGDEKAETGASRREAVNPTRTPTPLPGAATSPGLYAGAYYSDELDAIYRVLERSGGLVLERRGADPERLAILRDGVLESKELGHLAFSRDAQGGIAGFSIQVGDSRLAFARIRLPATP